MAGHVAGHGCAKGAISMERTMRSLLSAGAVLLAVSILARGQVDTGTVLGEVKDSSGAAVAGAKVTLMNEGTGLSSEAATGPDGSYIFPPVKIGTYTVTVEFQGFKKEVRPHIAVNVQDHVVLDFTLVPGSVTQTVEVKNAAPVLQTESTSVGQVVGATEINDLPLNGRNYVFLAQLSPGVTYTQQDNLPTSGATGQQASGAFSANGTRVAQSNFMLDGIDNNNTQPDTQAGCYYTVLLPIDALAEFRISTSNYNAELGRAGGAVLNAVTKSGTNAFHGDVWEFLRNDKFDAADFFENAAGNPKGEYRQNQFGGTLGGPLRIPVLWSAKNKGFFFIDYEGTRIRQGYPQVDTVPTATERNSGFTNYSEMITGLPGSTPADDLGRTFPLGQIFDPATTRPVTAGVADPVTGIVALQSGYVRDPFPGNLIPSGRLDPNAVRLLDLYPLPTGSGLYNNYFSDFPIVSNTNSGDVRIDENIGARDAIFLRFSYNHRGEQLPAPFPGLANGGAQGLAGSDDITSSSSVLGWTHTFSPTTINEFRIGFQRLDNAQVQDGANTLGIPASYGIQGIPQYDGNGGLPTMLIGGLGQLGVGVFLPLWKIGNLWDMHDNVTKVHGRHNIKVGVQYEYNFIPYLVPPTSRGQFTFSGFYTSIPGANVGDTGIAQFALAPTASTVPNGIDNVGGMDFLAASSSVHSTFVRKYLGAFLQDDLKVNAKLTLNLGVRYEYYSPYEDRYNSMANFVPGTPFAGAEYLYPTSQQGTLPAAFLQSLQQDGIAFVRTSNVAGISPKDDFAPRFGLAYQLAPSLVLRAAYGLFYGGFANNGGVSQTGAFSFPFLYNLNFYPPDLGHPITPDNSIGGLENGLLNVPLTPSSVTSADGFRLSATQYKFPQPYTQDVNLMVQYQVSPNQSFQIGYVGTFTRHLLVWSNANNVSEILPPALNPQQYVPYPDFARNFTYMTANGNGYYHSLQATFERRFSQGLNFLADYTWSKCRTDAEDPGTENAEANQYRAPAIPGFGIYGDYGACNTDTRNIVHVAGSYQLPFGTGKRFASNSGRLANGLVGGWSLNWILTLQDGQPFTIYSNITTAAGVGADALLVPGQNPIGGPHNVNQWMNPNAFANAPVATAVGQSNLAPLGGAPTQVWGPGTHRLDLSLFKQFQTSERTLLEFRVEFFNLTNTPNFSMPVPFSPAVNFQSPDFGQITMTRDAPFDPRQIQFALKFYW
jgi:hypothetical protein